MSATRAISAKTLTVSFVAAFLLAVFLVVAVMSSAAPAVADGPAPAPTPTASVGTDGDTNWG